MPDGILVGYSGGNLYSQITASAWSLEPGIGAGTVTGQTIKHGAKVYGLAQGGFQGNVLGSRRVASFEVTLLACKFSCRTVSCLPTHHCYLLLPAPHHTTAFLYRGRVEMQKLGSAVFNWFRVFVIDSRYLVRVLNVARAQRAIPILAPSSYL